MTHTTTFPREEAQPRNQRLIVDSHCHAGPSWYEPVEALLYHMDANGVDHALLVQHNGMYDNEYLLRCQERFPGRFSVAVQVDPETNTPERTLAELASRGAQVVRCPLDGPGAFQGWIALCEEAAALGMGISVQADPATFASDRFRDIRRASAGTPIILEHLAGLGREHVRPPYDGLDAAFATILEYARYDHVYVKVPGLGELCDRPERLGAELRFDNIPRQLPKLAEAFGAARLMWGSDFPACSAREGYRNTLEGIRRLASFSEADLGWVLGNTAASVLGALGYHR